MSSEDLPIRKVAAVGVGALVVFAVAVLWMQRILVSTAGAIQPARARPVPAEIGRAEIGMVDQVPFAEQKDARDAQRTFEPWLHSYGWVDREQGIIHVPLERALELYLAGERPSGGHEHHGHEHRDHGGHHH